MRRYLISASKLDRLAACPPSAVLPIQTSESGVYAERGNEIHEFCRRVGVDPLQRDAALDCVSLEYRKTCANINFGAVLFNRTVVAAEPAYAVDTVTGAIVFLGTNIGRDYDGAMKKLCGRGISETEVCTSLDVEALDVSGIPVALDYKSGRQTKPAKDMWQIRLQAYVLAIKYDANEVMAGCIYIDEDGNFTPDFHVFNRMDLDDVPSDLRAIRARIAAAAEEVAGGATPVLYPGEHCQYCESLRGCPAQTAMIKRALLDLDTVDPSVILSLTPEQVGAAFAKHKRIKQLSEKLDDAFKLMIAQNGGVIPADEGFEYRQSTGSRSYLPPDAVRGLLVKHGVPLDEVTKLQRTTTYPIVRRVKCRT